MATLRITGRIFSIGGRIIQISNIAEADIVQDESDKSTGAKWLVGGAASLIACYFVYNQARSDDRSLILGLLGFSILCFVFAYMYFTPRYLLFLQTNAGRIVPLKSKDVELLRAIIQKLHDAMSQEAVNYSIDISDSIIMDSQFGNIAGRDVNKN